MVTIGFLCFILGALYKDIVFTVVSFIFFMFIGLSVLTGGLSENTGETTLDYGNYTVTTYNHEEITYFNTTALGIVFILLSLWTVFIAVGLKNG